MTVNLLNEPLKEPTQEIDDVHCVEVRCAEEGDTLVCTLGSEQHKTRYFIPYQWISEKSEVTRPGEHGILIVTHTCVRLMGWPILAGIADLIGIEKFTDKLLLDALEDLRLPGTTLSRPDEGEGMRKAIIAELIRRKVYPEIPPDNPNSGSDWRDHTLGPPFKREHGILSANGRLIRWDCPDCKTHFPNR